MTARGETLAFLRSGGGPVARRRGEVIGAEALLGEIERLASLLPDHAFVVNLCADRIRFAVGLAAAMLRGQVTLLPGTPTPATMAPLLDRYPSLYALCDEPDAAPLPIASFRYPAGEAGASRDIPAFPPGQIAAILFTSGTTGEPQPSPRSWGRLVEGCRAAGAALGIDRFAAAPVVATIPHAHSYGLESAVMLPLQHGLLLDADRPFFPADVAAALEGAGQAGVLVTTPVHMRALVGDTTPARAGQLAPADQPAPANAIRAGLVLSATAPLGEELARQVERVTGAAVHEIYGCSEAGQIATRRTSDGASWQCLDGFGLRQDKAGTWACGPHENDVLLADVLEPVTSARFLLHGRAADQVNVAGKRSSLAYLTHQLVGIDGVQDGAFLIPDDDMTGAASRLAALVVAPGLDATAIMSALRERIDPAFLPRPLRLVAALPRDALGKLPRPDLLRQWRAAESAPEQRDASLPPFSFAVDHPASVGHFPGNPIVPGAVLLDHVWSLICPDGGLQGGIEAVKFHQPVRPGERIVVSCTPDGGSIRFECRLADSQRLVMSGAARPASPPR